MHLFMLASMSYNLAEHDPYSLPSSSNPMTHPSSHRKTKTLTFASNFNQSLLSFFPPSLPTLTQTQTNLFTHFENFILLLFIMLSDLHSIKQDSNRLLSNERSDMSVWSLPEYFKVLLFLIKKYLCFHLVHLVELQELK